nr:unnamed protein product [Callosobruchus chinensis]
MYLALLLPLLFRRSSSNVIYSNADNEISPNDTSTPQHYVEYVLLDSSHPCARTCVLGAPPMVCRYNFEVEWYHTLSKACYDCPYNVEDCFRKDCVPGDGNKRPIVTVNRRIPGPSVQVCHNDVIIVDVTNKLMSEGTTIHWHGQHQKETPYMDGVPYVTQCPILPHDTFRYIFKAEQVGTHFWHSHIGMQRVDGVYGPLIVKQPEEQDPVSQFYDFDLPQHVMMIIDWEKPSSMDKFLAHHHNGDDNKPTTLLINGLGRFKEFNTDINETIYTPMERFNVEQGYRYRFRIINAGFLNCPIEISIDNHTLTVIGTDGDSIKPLEAASLVTYAGERFDIVVTANQDKGLYWIRFRGLMDCDERFKRTHQVAVLEYEGLNVTRDDYPEGDPDYESSHRDGLQVNALNRGVESDSSHFVSMPEIESLREWDDSLRAKPDIQYYVAYDFYKIDNHDFHRRLLYGFYNMTNPDLQLLTPQFNHITMSLLPFPLLPQRDEIPNDAFCNAETLKEKNCETDHCQCPHAIKIPLDSVVELIFVDEGFAYDANHPLHLHGYAFRVVAMERVGKNVTVEEVKDRDRRGLIKRNLLNPPLKDTVTVPDGGYTVVRFKADNPGYWIFHCHLEFHAEIGMAMVLQVGEKEDMKPVPKNFPRCGNYLPEFLSNDTEQKTNSASKSTTLSVLVPLLLMMIFLHF